MATIKKSATKLNLSDKSVDKLTRVGNRLSKRDDRQEARQDRRAERRGDNRVSMKPITPIAATSVTDRQSLKPIKPLAAKVSVDANAPNKLKLGKQAEGKPAKIATGPRTALATEKAPASTESFGQAFRRNKDAKAKTFEYKGKSYTTDTKEDVAKKAAPIKKAETSIPTPYSTHAQADKDTAAKKAAASTSTSGKRPAPEFKYPDYPSASGSAMTGGPESNDKNRPSQAPKKTAPAPPPNRRGLPPAKCGTKIKSKKK